MKADLILKSKTIFTAVSEVPLSGSVAIQGNRIMDVYTGEKPEYTGAATTVLDFGNKLIMPGFVDGHTHYFLGALAASDHMCCEIFQSSSEAECVKMVQGFAEKHPHEKRIVGMGWFPANWNDAPLPSKRSLDAAFPDKPVYLISADVHTFWLNTKALEESGITAYTRPKSGDIGKFDDGDLSGLLFEPEAFGPAMAKVMDVEKDIMKEIHRNFLRYINEKGVTSISEMSADDYTDATFANYSIIQEMEKEGDLSCRLHVYTKLDGYTDFSEALRWRNTFWSDTLRVNGVKGFIDGVTSTYTGLLLEPYADRPDSCGVNAPNIPREEMEKYIIAANKAGLDVRLHCIADGSVRMALDMYQVSKEQNHGQDVINVIEHIENIHPDDIGRFARLGVIPSMQPYHLTLDFNEKITRIGRKRCLFEWPHKSILEAGGNLAFGTDYPVVDFNPFPSIYAAVTRRDDDGVPTGINPDECISLAQALTAYTAGAAAAYHRDDVGVLAPGKLADIIVVDRDLFNVDPRQIKDASVVMTVMDGKVVYERT